MAAVDVPLGEIASKAFEDLHNCMVDQSCVVNLLTKGVESVTLTIQFCQGLLRP